MNVSCTGEEDGAVYDNSFVQDDTAASGARSSTRRRTVFTEQMENESHAAMRARSNSYAAALDTDDILDDSGEASIADIERKMSITSLDVVSVVSTRLIHGHVLLLCRPHIFRAVNDAWVSHVARSAKPERLQYTPYVPRCYQTTLESLWRFWAISIASTIANPRGIASQFCVGKMQLLIVLQPCVYQANLESDFLEMEKDGISDRFGRIVDLDAGYLPVNE